MYRDRFEPSMFGAAPRAMLATSVICAETDEEAARLATSFDLTILRLHQGRSAPFPSPEEAMAYSYSPRDLDTISNNRGRLTFGTPERCRERLLELADAAAVDEIMVTTMIHSHAARRRSYELLADAFALAGVGESGEKGDFRVL